LKTPNSYWSRGNIGFWTLEFQTCCYWQKWRNNWLRGQTATGGQKTKFERGKICIDVWSNPNVGNVQGE